MIRRAAVVAFAIGVLACPAGASAARKWLEPATVFDQSAALGVTVAMAPDGTAMIARVRAVAPFQVLEAVVKPPGEPPSPPVELARSAPARAFPYGRRLPGLTAGSWSLRRDGSTR